MERETVTPADRFETSQENNTKNKFKACFARLCKGVIDQLELLGIYQLSSSFSFYIQMKSSISLNKFKGAASRMAHLAVSNPFVPQFVFLKPNQSSLTFAKFLVFTCTMTITVVFQLANLLLQVFLDLKIIVMVKKIYQGSSFNVGVEAFFCT